MTEEAEQRPDAWGELNARYRHRDDAQFLLVADQLVEVRELLLSGTLAKLRLGLVAVDNLAEVLLARHLGRLDGTAQQPVRIVLPRLDAQKRRRFRSDFGYRVGVGLQGATHGWAAPYMPPLLDKRDAAIFRTGHEYRNRVYHADHHNAAVLPVMPRLYMAAVCRAWTRQQSTSSASSMTPWFQEQVDRLGYDDAARAQGEFGPGFFASGAAAETIGGRLSDDLQPELATLKEQLSDDLLWRTAWTEEMFEHLAGEAGGRDRLLKSLRWQEAWDEFGHDPELVRLTGEIARLEVPLEGDYQTDFNKIAELYDQRNDRVRQLLADTHPQFELAETIRISNLARRLRTALNAGSLLNRYEQLDRRIEKIERLLDDAAIAWDRHVQEETDRLRDK